MGCIGDMANLISAIFCRKCTLALLLLCSLLIFSYNALFIVNSSASIYKNITNMTVESLKFSLLNSYALQDENSKFLLDTEGCRIPNFKLKWTEAKKKFKSHCGVRMVEVAYKNGTHVQFSIRKPLQNCLYWFIHRSNTSHREDTDIKESKSVSLKDRAFVELQSDFIGIKCKHKKTVYKDVITAVKKSNSEDDEIRPHWNVLIIGMDTMSRWRTKRTLKMFNAYVKKNGWLDFTGYQKIGDNTFPNMMAFLTGQNTSRLYKACRDTMDKCNSLIVWNDFKKAGYATAYGEDDISLPDTFTRFKGFVVPPTDHYMRPLFISSEMRQDSHVCTGRMSSGEALLSYAEDFAKTYSNGRYFGFFWMNSFSHNPTYEPVHIDSKLADFFRRVRQADITNNTFLIFISDHGYRFHKLREKVETFYEGKLPVLYIYVPEKFKSLHPDKSTNAYINQNRLITPYSLYVTFRDILTTSDSSTGPVSEACPKCTSLFTETAKTTTCEDLAVPETWCSCRVLTPALASDTNRAIETVINYINKGTSELETARCTRCAHAKLKQALRGHSYYSNNTKYIVVAFITTAGGMGYEATLDSSFEIIGQLSIITGYNGLGHCVKNSNWYRFCVCENVNCKSTADNKTNG